MNTMLARSPERRPGGDRRDAALRRLVEEHVLTEVQADAVLAALRAEVPAVARLSWWIEALGYIGGGLLLAGAATLVGMSWDELGRAGQVLLLAAVTLLLTVAGGVVGGGPCGVRRLGGAVVRRRVVGVCLALAAVTASATVGVGVAARPDIWAAGTGLLAAVVGYAAVRTVPGLLATAVFATFLVSSVVDATTSVLALAGALVALGGGFTAAALAGIVTPRPLGVGVGCVIALMGAQQPMGSAYHPAWAYVTTILIGAACLALSRWQRSVLLLIAGVAGVTIGVPEAVWDLTGGLGGAAAILLGTGGVLLATSALALRLHR